MDTKEPIETMNVALPESMKEFVHTRVAAGGYSSASEYVRELIREAQRKAAAEELEALLIEGINSGPPTEMTGDDWRWLHDQSEKRWAHKKGRSE